jgi:hypothetical protein
MIPRLSTASFRVSPQANPCQSFVSATLLPRFEILLVGLVGCGNSWRLIIMSSRTATVVIVRARFFPLAFCFSGCEFKRSSSLSRWSGKSQEDPTTASSVRRPCSAQTSYFDNPSDESSFIPEQSREPGSAGTRSSGNVGEFVRRVPKQSNVIFHTTVSNPAKISLTTSPNGEATCGPAPDTITITRLVS